MPKRLPPTGFTAIWDAMTLEERDALVRLVGTSHASMRHVARGHRAASPTRAKLIVAKLKMLGRSATLHDIRPDIWE